MTDTRVRLAASPTHCRRCGEGPLYPYQGGGPKELRHAGRGLCKRCHGVLWRRYEAGHDVEGDSLIDYERIQRSNANVIESWQELSAEGYTKQQAADRMDMTYAALDQALVRHRRRQRKAAAE
jgi:hypothetical protein